MEKGREIRGEPV